MCFTRAGCADNGETILIPWTPHITPMRANHQGVEDSIHSVSSQTMTCSAERSVFYQSDGEREKPVSELLPVSVCHPWPCVHGSVESSARRCPPSRTPVAPMPVSSGL